jgi:hypothetical protein
VEEDDMLFRVRHAGRVLAERRQLRVARRGMGWAAGHLSASELVPRRARQVKMTWDAAPDAPDVHLDNTQVRVRFRLTQHHLAVNTASTAAA